MLCLARKGYGRVTTGPARPDVDSKSLDRLLKKAGEAGAEVAQACRKQGAFRPIFLSFL